MKTTYAIKIQFPVEEQEPAYGVLYSAGMLGCEEQEAADTVTCKAYFADRETAADALRALRKALNATGGEIETVVPQDWIAQWRASMQPARLTENIWVSPTWLKPEMAEGDLWIKIEPKMAFGTGHHATTRLAAAGIVKQQERISGQPFLDIGTGSGVLCFVADHCGADRSIGLEIDMDCQENLAENLTSNPASQPILFIIGTNECLQTHGFFGAIVMNMIRTQSEPLLHSCLHLLRPSGVLIWSGLLCEEKLNAIQAATTCGFNLLEESSEGEWWSGIFQRRD
jgi:ribosomal protein L11 methyltransferase